VRRSATGLFRIFVIWCCACLVFAGASVAAVWPAQARSLLLTLDGIDAPGLRIDGIRLAIPDLAGRSATLSVARVTLGESS